MNLFKSILFLFAFLPSVVVKSQIVFTQQHYDFKVLTNWSQTPAIFEFSNNGNAEDAILKTVKSSNVHVKYPATYIKSGEKNRILIYYEPPNTGFFQEKIKIYTALSEKPFELSISGQVTSVLECPSLNMPPDKSTLISLHTILVIDSFSRQEVSNASVNIIAATGESWIKKTGKNGKVTQLLEPGMYNFAVRHPDYQTHDELYYINKNKTLTIITLVPLSEKKQDSISTDTFVVVKPPKPEKPSEYIVISGIVIDAVTEKPVGNARLKFFDSYGVMQPFTTFNDGKFRLLMKRGEYSLKITAKNYYDYEDTLKVQSSQEGITYILIPIDFDITYTQNDRDTIKPKDDTVIQNDIDTVFSINNFKPNNIVFLVDVSSSMGKMHKLENLKSAMIKLTEMLRKVDLLSMMSFSSEPKLVFASIPSDRKDTIINSINSLQAYGLTFGIKGLESAYQLALDNYIEGGNNQLIIATDGDFNSPDHSEIELLNLLLKYANKGIALSVIGFGNDTKSIRRLKAMAAVGKGKYLHFDNTTSLQDLLIENIKTNSRKK